MIYAMITICNFMTVRQECLFLSDKLGPYYSIDQCLDRNKKIYRDSNRVLPKYSLKQFQCRSEHGLKYSRKIAISKDI